MADSGPETLRAAGDRPWRFFVVPHTHWDREWYAPFEHFRLALGRVVDEVLTTLESDPAFASFTLDGQAIVLEDYVDVRPGHEARLRALVAAGRIEVGPSYVLPDEFLAGAEPLVRNLLLGRAVCERFGAEPAPVGYMPDSFGHPAQLPQILAGFGISTFLFSRGLGDQLGEHGVVFRWRAPDGSEVLAFQLLPHYDNFATVEDVSDAQERVAAIVERFGPALARAGVSDVLLCNGSDHLPIQPELPVLCAELERRATDGARYRIARYGDYAAAVSPGALTVVDGELLGSRLQNVLRGVNSARLYLKQANQRAEQRLLAVETLAALRALSGGPGFPAEEFALAWRELLRCHPHDSICGCSCDEVHRDMLVRYASLHRTLDELTPGPGEALFNPLPWRRQKVVDGTVVELDGFAVSGAAGARVPEVRATDTTIENDLVRIETAEGRVIVTDLRTGRRFDGLHRLEDEPDVGDLYTFCPVPGTLPWTSGSASARVLRTAPAVGELELCFDGEPSLNVRTVVRITGGSPLVAFRTTLQNRAHDHRLRAVFPVGEVLGPVRAEGHFAVVERPLVPQPPRSEWAEPPDLTQHTLGAVALGPLAVLTKGLPEYEARVSSAGAELCLTLVRSVGVISRPAGALSTRPLSAGPAVLTPEGQCPGRHELEYALLPGADALTDAQLLRTALDYRTEFVAVAAGTELGAPVRLEGDVVFSCLKGAQDGDGLILRCFNPGRTPASARVGGAVSVSRTRLDETSEAPIDSGDIEVRAGEVATLRIRRSPPDARR